MSESDNKDEPMCTPPEICDQAEIASHNLLPTKSKNLYESAYKSFTDWKNSSNTKSSSERVLMAYFNKLAAQYKPSTLWSQYSMIKTCIKLHEKIDIGNYHTLSAFMKKQSHGYQGKKSKVLTTEEINKFLQESPDEMYLLTKIVLIFGISGACRKDELTKITLQDIENQGNLFLVKVPDTKTAKARAFTIATEFHEKLNKYKALRPSRASTNRFFLNYKSGKCTVQVVGKNKFGKMPQEIASYLGLPDVDLYTGHCFRRTSATVLADSGANITTLKRHGGWKSTSVAEGYVEESIQNKTKIGCIISSAINTNTSSSMDHDTNSMDSEEPLLKRPKLDSVIDQSSTFEMNNSNKKKFFNFSNCTNITIKYKGTPN